LCIVKAKLIKNAIFLLIGAIPYTNFQSTYYLWIIPMLCMRCADDYPFQMDMKGQACNIDAKWVF